MPPVTTQTTYDDNSGVIQKRVITDYITLIDPADASFVEAMGGLDGGAKKFRFVNFPHTKVEWIEDTREPLAVGLNTAMNTVVPQPYCWQLMPTRCRWDRFCCLPMVQSRCGLAQLRLMALL